MDTMAAIRETFFQECEEQLGELEVGLVAMENGDADPETVNAVFRAVHSIKGGAGAFKLDRLVRFAHTFETTLDLIRSDKLAPSSAVLKTMLRSADVLADLVKAARTDEPVDEARMDALIDELKACADAGAAAPSDGKARRRSRGSRFPAADAFASTTRPTTVEPAASGYTIRFTPRPDLYRKGNETVRLLRELARLGDVSTTCETRRAAAARPTRSRRRLSDLAGRTVDDPRTSPRSRKCSSSSSTIASSRSSRPAPARPTRRLAPSPAARTETRRRRARRRRRCARAASVRRPRAAGRRTMRMSAPPRGGPGSRQGAIGTRQGRSRGGDDPRRSRARRSTDQSGRRAGDQSGDAVAAGDGGGAGAIVERGGGPRRARTTDAGNSGRRHGDPRPAGEAAVPAHVAHRARTDRRHGKVGAAANRGRGDRSRPNRHRASGRSAHPHDPQRGRSRRRDARSSRGGGQSRPRRGQAFGGASLRTNRHRGLRRRRRNQPAARSRDRRQEGTDRARRAAHRRRNRQSPLSSRLLHGDERLQYFRPRGRHGRRQTLDPGAGRPNFDLFPARAWDRRSRSVCR